MNPRLKEQYKNLIVKKLKDKFSLKNNFMVPKVEKVVLNMGLGADASDKKKLQNCIEDMSLISGQRPVVTRFRKSISNFKTRKSTPAGVKVTLRNKMMYEFIDRLVNIALPRIKDFRGLNPNSFDKFGNYTFGIKEHIIFPEVNFDKAEKIRGLDITISIKTEKIEHSYELLKKINFPFLERKGN